MGEDESEVNLLDELNKQFGKHEESGFGEYTQDMQKIGFTPDNPYGHAWTLVNSPARKLETDGFNILNDPQIFLGNIENEKSLRLIQNDLNYLTNICGMALEDPIFKDVFNVLWQIFKTEVRITSAMGGTERQYQAFQPNQPVSSTSRGFSFFGKKRKKPKDPVEYLLPQDEESMY